MKFLFTIPCLLLLLTSCSGSADNPPPGSPDIRVSPQEVESIIAVLKDGYSDELKQAGVTTPPCTVSERGDDIHDWAVQESVFQGVPYAVTDTPAKLETYIRTLLGKHERAGIRSLYFGLDRLTWKVTVALEAAGDKSGKNAILQRLNQKWKSSKP